MDESVEQPVVKGVEETKEVITMFAAFVKALEASMLDGKISFEDVGNLMIAIPSVGAAVQGIADVPGEIADLVEAEEKDLISHIDAQFGEGKYQLVGEDVLQGIVHFASAVAKFRGA